MERVWHRKASARLFENDTLEAISKIHPVVPFAFYLPIVAGLLGWSLYQGRTTPEQVLVFGALGLFTWQLMEYFLHRFFFHWEGVGPVTRRVHEIIHGYHHRYPDDDRRLVMPLSASIPLAIVVYGLLWALAPAAAVAPWFAGIVLGYLWYDFLHWSVHARTPRTAYGRHLRAHHMIHHFANPDTNFGISHRWIDHLARTYEAPPKRG